MNSESLKEYIIEKNLTRNLLEQIGCHSFMPYTHDIRCALPNDDDNSKVSVNPETLGIRVFTKGKSIYGDIYNLIMYINQCEFKEAYKTCCTLLNVNSNYTKIIKKESPIDFYKKIKLIKEDMPMQKYYDLSILNRYNKIFHIDLIKNDSLISQKILEKYYVMFDERTNRIVFPHLKYDDKTKVAGVVGRTVNKSYKELKLSKYLSLLDTDYKKLYNLYGLSLNIEYIKEWNIVIVFEAEKSVMKADMFGYPIGVAVGCHELSNFQRKLLIGLDVEVCIAFDKDVELEHILNICKELNYFRKVSYIQDKWNLLKEKDAPVDRGYKRWNYLFRNRIVYKG